jgi:hypothetical protein
MKHIFLAGLIFINFLTLRAQTDSTENKAHFKLSVNYNSGLNYYGRTDSLKSSGVFPLSEIWFSPNFYINAAPIFVNNDMQSFDYAGTIASIGYQYMNEKWLANISFLKPFYKENTELVQSALKAQGSLSISRLNKIINFTLGCDLKWSDKLDFGATGGMDHIIRIQNRNNSVIVLDPAFYAYAGTQEFTRTYNKKQGNGLLLPPTNQQVTEKSTGFNILAYEVSMPVIYSKGKLMLIATPSYIMPQNLINVADRPDLSERGENMFYTTIGLKYSF